MGDGKGYRAQVQYLRNLLVLGLFTCPLPSAHQLYLMVGPSEYARGDV